MTLALANLVLAAYMTGVIWVVQVVHYPLFAAVGRAQWPAYEAAHRRRITAVVGPPMLAQPVVAAALLAERPGVLAGANSCSPRACCSSRSPSSAASTAAWRRAGIPVRTGGCCG